MWYKAILLIVLVSLACQLSDAKCSCGSIGSYNYLSDPSFDINMDSYDEFARTSTEDATAQPAQTKQLSSLRLDLSDSKHINIALFKADDSLFGRGNITIDNTTEQAGAVGALANKKLNLDLVSVKGVLYRLNLTVDEDRVEGNYSEIEADGKLLLGTVKGQSMNQKT